MKITINSTGHFTTFTNGQVLDLEHKGKKFTVSVDDKDTISKLKEKIKAVVQVPAKQQVLNFNKNQLNDDKKTLESMGIKVGSAASFVFQFLKLFPLLFFLQDKSEVQLSSTLDTDEAPGSESEGDDD
jgi:hypothetical protein